jgi:hypothetical protein
LPRFCCPLFLKGVLPLSLRKLAYASGMAYESTGFML